jgi:hypothetical protein
MHMIGVKFVEVISVGRRYWLRYSTVTKRADRYLLALTTE